MSLRKTIAIALAAVVAVSGAIPAAAQQRGFFEQLFGPPPGAPRPPAAVPRQGPPPVLRETAPSFWQQLGGGFRADDADPRMQGRTVPAQFRRQTVAIETRERPGTIVIDSARKFLFFVTGPNQAIRYGVGVGRDGFGWRGTVSIGRKAEWPGWTPPAAMRRRQPELPAYMPGGENNPLGARAMYLYRGGRDTLYRIHGTNQPWTIGLNVSSGCIRMMNADVIDLYNRAGVGAKVVVL